MYDNSNNETGGYFMEVFLSWSGERSRYLAKSFNEWLPSVLQYVNPFMSEQDIGLGTRWSTDIEDNLRSNNFGIVFVTPENIDAPWINFEAGALSKNLQSRLVPIIYDSDVTLLSSGPLKQFQSVKKFDKDSIHDLIKNINSVADDDYKLSQERLDSSFEKWWPDLDNTLKSTPEIKEVEDDETQNDFDTQALKLILNKLETLERRDSSSLNTSDRRLSKQYNELIELNNVIYDLKLRANLLPDTLNSFNPDISDDEIAKMKNNQIIFIERINLLVDMVTDMLKKYERYR